MPIGCAKRAVGTMLAIRNPSDRMLTVLKSSASVNDDQRDVGADRVVASAAEDHQRQRDRREEQLDQHVRRQDRVRPQRRGAQPLEDAAFAVDRDDRDQRQHGAHGDQQRREDGQIDRDEARHVRRAGVAPRRRASGPAPRRAAPGRPPSRTTPSGSRTKILISSQVSFQSPRSMVCSLSRESSGRSA